MKQQPFIASYPKDYEWLTPCLQTFRRHGPPFFEPPVVCQRPRYARMLTRKSRWSSSMLSRARSERRPV
jgi:hypothetical protein